MALLGALYHNKKYSNKEDRTIINNDKSHTPTGIKQNAE